MANNKSDKELEAEVKAEVKTEAKAEAKKPVEKEYIVKTQVSNYNGIVAGVQFAYGKSAVPVKEGWILQWFREKGYIVEEVK